MGYLLNLRIQGIVLGVIHCLCGVGALIMTILAEKGGTFNDVFPFHYINNIWVDCKTRRHEQVTAAGADNILLRARMLDWCNGTNSDKAMSYGDIVWFDVSLGWLVFVYFVWTGVWHLLYVTLFWRRYVDCIDEQMDRFYLRWFEYAVSASIMMFLIVYFLGITNLAVICLLSANMFFIIIVPFISRRGQGPEYIVASVYYSVIWLYLFVTFIVENVEFLNTIPWYVYLIVFGEFLLYSSFGFVFFLEEWRIRHEKGLFLTETIYNALSAASKLLLGMVLGFVVFNNRA